MGWTPSYRKRLPKLDAFGCAAMFVFFEVESHAFLGPRNAQTWHCHKGSPGMVETEQSFHTETSRVAANSVFSCWNLLDIKLCHLSHIKVDKVEKISIYLSCLILKSVTICIYIRHNIQIIQQETVCMWIKLVLKSPDPSQLGVI